jgi:hypothetical protein
MISFNPTDENGGLRRYPDGDPVAHDQDAVAAVMQAIPVDADTIDYTLVGVPQDGALSVNLTVGALTDQFGNPMLPFAATYINGSTKFYVVNDASADRTYEYANGGITIENYTLGSGNTAPAAATSRAKRAGVYHSGQVGSLGRHFFQRRSVAG